MKFRRTGPFKRDYAKLPKPIRRRVEKALRLLLRDIHHPSLKARIVDKKRRIWKANIDGGYRFTFQIEGDTIILRRIGAHRPMERSNRW